MIARRFAWFKTASLCAFILVSITVLVGSQPASKEKAPVAETAKSPRKPPTQAPLRDAATRKALVDKMIADYDLTPHRAPVIPDNPPPHEGALINLPVVVEPPDLVVVEVLEALEGRPISGERLVKPDGTIQLGFYGEAQVRGLTLPQVKVAIIKELRKFLDDETLGLTVMKQPGAEMFVPDRPAIPPVPGNGNPFDLNQAADASKKQEPPRPIPALEPANAATEESWTIVPPDASDKVFVDISGFNSMNYYVQGDVLITGRNPSTGNETVLDALQYAGGLMSTADPKQISLIRPERKGRPAKVYKVDLEAIQERGEVATNYQIFPGDRLFVGRNEVVKKTAEMDRLNAPLQTMTGMMLQQAFALRALQLVSVDHRDELLKEYVDFWARELSHSTGVKFDEQTMRDAFIRKMKLTPAPVAAEPGAR